MKISETIWLERLAQMSAVGEGCAKRVVPDSQTPSATVLFLNELCCLIEQYVPYFNERVSLESQAQSLQWFLLRPQRNHKVGLVATRQKDKLVIFDEGPFVCIKMSQCALPQERIYNVLRFEPRRSELGTILWHCENDGQYVNPELVATHYLSPFLAYGCLGCTDRAKPYPRLVAVGK